MALNEDLKPPRWNAKQDTEANDRILDAALRAGGLAIRQLDLQRREMAYTTKRRDRAMKWQPAGILCIVRHRDKHSVGGYLNCRTNAEFYHRILVHQDFEEFRQRAMEFVNNTYIWGEDDLALWEEIESALDAQSWHLKEDHIIVGPRQLTDLQRVDTIYTQARLYEHIDSSITEGHYQDRPLVNDGGRSRSSAFLLKARCKWLRMAVDVIKGEKTRWAFAGAVDARYSCVDPTYGVEAEDINRVWYLFKFVLRGKLGTPSQEWTELPVVHRRPIPGALKQLQPGKNLWSTQ